MRETIAELKRRIERQGMEMMALEMELDATKEENRELLRRVVNYQEWHIRALNQQDEEGSASEATE